MGEVTMQTVAYAKIILHAAKYPHCSVTGILLADGTKIKEGAKNQNLDIVDSIPLFHHSHYVSPMAEIALTQIETMAQADNRVIAGFYAACENYRDNTVDKCPGQKIAEKIAEFFPSAVFIVVDNKRIVQHLDTTALKLHRHAEGKWKPKEINRHFLSDPYALQTTSMLLQTFDLIDFDNYLDDVTQDWTNYEIKNSLENAKQSFIEQIKQSKITSN